MVTFPNKVTLATIKSLAKKGLLKHEIKSTFNGMIDGIESIKNPMLEKTTLEFIENEIAPYSNRWFYKGSDTFVTYSDNVQKIYFTL